VPVVIDGLDNDSCWNNARWHNIDKVWIPYGATMQEGDFEGYYKAAWDSNYLYLLVKVIDDSLADYYTDPLSNWWNDDCVEIFLDEDRSKGYHECNYNAFAYHVSIFYDAIDMSTTCAGINLRNNLIVKMDTIAPHTYLWEFAIKVYNKNFNPQNPEQSRVKLKPGKTMGFAVAYCDDDGNPNHERENFIGSIFMPAAHNNDNYKTADYLGQMVLVDTKNLWDGEEPSGIAETIVQQGCNFKSSWYGRKGGVSKQNTKGEKYCAFTVIPVGFVSGVTHQWLHNLKWQVCQIKRGLFYQKKQHNIDLILCCKLCIEKFIACLLIRRIQFRQNLL